MKQAESPPKKRRAARRATGPDRSGESADMNSARRSAALKNGSATRSQRSAASSEAAVLQRALTLAEAELKRQKLRTSRSELDSTALKRQVAALRTQLDAASEARIRAEEALHELGPDASPPDSGASEAPEREEPPPLSAPKLPRAGRSLPTTRVGSAVRKARFRLADLQDRVQDEIREAQSEAGSLLKAVNPVPLVSPAMRKLDPAAWRRKLPRFGRRRAPTSPLFDSSWIARDRPELKGVTYKTYLASPELHQLDPHPLFSAAYYLERYPDVSEAKLAPLQHYLDHGWREGRDPHPYFANAWYLKENPDVAAAGMNPLVHYLLAGSSEGRRPNPVFDPRTYLERYPDVAAAGIEPLTHYVVHGRAEKRDPVRGYGPEWKSLAPPGFEGDLMDFLLCGSVSLSDGDARERALVRRERTNRAWPPRPLGGFTLPYQLASFTLDSYGDDTLDLVEFLCSVMDAYSEDPDSFPASSACEQLLSRARALSQLRMEQGAGPLQASVIVPVYNNILDTLLCIVSVLESDSESNYEIIVADDGSNDATSRLIPEIRGVVRHLRQPKNLGFLGNCNAAAEEARGATIVLLNNDTLVFPGWLDNLLLPFQELEKVGLVGSKLLSWDGSLQEAGGIFWADGSAWNFGRNDDPGAPEYNYLKDVDYCSGASIAVPRPLWRELDGFDPIFTPAYCEDADLAFRIRRAGYRTLYAPQSELIHHEGRSHGRDTASGLKAYQVVNQRKLFERWKNELERDHFPNGTRVLDARDRSARRPHLLFIDHYVPQWDRDAGSRTIYQYLKIFRDLGCQITFWPDNLFRDPIYTPLLQEMGVEVIYGTRYHDGFDRFMSERGGLYDMAFVSRPQVAAKYLPSIREHGDARILFYGHDLHFLRMERAQALGMPVDQSDIDEMREIELEVCGQSDVIFYPDVEETRLLEKLVGGEREFIPNPVFVYGDEDLETGRRNLKAIKQQKSKRLFFVGGFSHAPNAEGIVWFVEKVLPKITAKIADVKLDIAGSNPPANVSRLASKQVAVLGLVSDEDLQNLYNGAGVAIAPLRYGAGVKGKVIEAMAAGVPVATTSIGAQGIDDAPDKMFIGDDPDQLARAIVKALTNRSEAARKAKAGFDFVTRNYARSALEGLFGRLLSDAGSRPR